MGAASASGGIVVQGYYTAVVRELRVLGFQFHATAKGSHEKWIDAHGRVLIVPRNLYKRHTANGILKAAGSTIRF
jgi:predicted RNA binding protein YcfA (HicA-like mRNA interferase family)